MSVLVTYGSKHRKTKALAEMVADGLRREGFTVDLSPTTEVQHIDRYEAVIVGGALYAVRSHRDAARFMKHHSDELQQRPTFYFSSGPHDGSVVKDGVLDRHDPDEVRTWVRSIAARIRSRTAKSD